MAEKRNTYNILVVLIAAIGSLCYGYTISILGNALGKPQFYEYLGLEVTGPTAGHTESLIAAWNCLLYVGGLIACISYPWISGRYGRRVPIFLSGVSVIIGGGLQAGIVNSGMLCAARVIIGFATGFILCGVPLYQAEIAPPHSRGLMVGLHASLLGYGTMLAQWVGVGFFHVGGQTGWRVPFAINCVPALFLVVLIWRVPESPRWLYMQGRHKEAEAVFLLLHGDSSDPENTFAHKEYLIMQSQLSLEAESKLTITAAMKQPSMRKRFILGWLTMSGTQFSGLLVILTYQQVIYANLGFSPFMVGVMSGIWCTINGTGNFIGALIIDKVGRTRQLICGYIGCVTCLVLECILVALYGDGSNRAGNRAAVFFIFLIIVCYTIGVESASFVYTSELFPSEWRGLGIAFSMFGLFIWSIIFTAVASPAFATIGWRFYIVFASASTMMIVLVAFFFPETKGYTIEQMAAVFGDDVVGESGQIEHAAEFKAEHSEKGYPQLAEVEMA